MKFSKGHGGWILFSTNKKQETESLLCPEGPQDLALFQGQGIRMFGAEEGLIQGQARMDGLLSKMSNSLIVFWEFLQVKFKCGLQDG